MSEIIIKYSYRLATLLSFISFYGASIAVRFFLKYKLTEKTTFILKENIIFGDNYENK